MSQARMIASLAFAAFLQLRITGSLLGRDRASGLHRPRQRRKRRPRGETSAPAQRGGRYLQLPDISFVGSAIGQAIR